MDDYRNASKSILGGSAMQAERATSASRGELSDINERLSYIQKRCGELANNLSSASARIFGAVPQEAENGGYAERGEGAAAALHITIDKIEYILADAEREASRISRL